MSDYPDRLAIPKLIRLSAPSKMVFLSIHTRDIKIDGTRYKRVLVYGHAIYWRRAKKKTPETVQEFTFDNTFDFWQWVTSKINKRETLYLYAYDASTKFLAMDGFRQLPCCEFTLETIYLKFTTTIMKFSNGNKRLAVIDIQNYYPMKVEKLATSFGCNLPERPTGEIVTDEVKEYCKVKAGLFQVVLSTLIKETVQAERGSLKMTSSSTSHSIFRKSFMKHKIVVSHVPEVVAFEKSGYAGGYTGLSKLIEPGQPEIYKVDVNSMYPSVMVDSKFPVQMIEFSQGINNYHLERFLKGYCVIANVTLHTSEAIYPLTELENNFYPVGDFDVTLNTASLKYALEHDAIEKINKFAVYLGEPIFGDFVKDVYGRRMDARHGENPAQELFYKTVNNTLYGKFGQQRTETVRVGSCGIDEFEIMEAFSPEDGANWQEMHAGGSVLFIYRRGENEYTSYAIAGHVTDYARQKLFQLRNIAGQDHVFYMDTDSLFVDLQGLKNLKEQIDPEKLGALKLEETAPFFIGFAKKDYVFGNTRKLKGFDPNGKREEGNVFKSIKRVGVMGAVRHSLSSAAFWREVNTYYNPFIVNERFENDGKVTPLRLPDDAEYFGSRHYTMHKIKELAKIVLPQQQLAMVGEWLRV